MSEEQKKDEAHDQGEHGGGSVKQYIMVFVALCVLTSASFFTYSPYWPFQETPSVGWAFMMAVSCTKALLVMLFFMHLLWEANWKYVLTFPAAMMSVFLVLMLWPDGKMRTSNYSEQRRLHAAEPKDPGDAADEHHENHEPPHNGTEHGHRH